MDTYDKEITGFFYSVIKSSSFIGYCSKAATGTSHSQRRVSPDILMLYQLPFERSTALTFSKIERKIHDMQFNLLEEISELTKQRDELLPLLMSGQVIANTDR